MTGVTPQTVLREEARRSTLGERLRSETRAAHAASEAAFDLPARLTSVDRYADALEAIESVHRACAPALAVVADRLPSELRDGPRRRRERLHADLQQLARAPRRAADRFTGLSGAGFDLDCALGSWYVLEGAALGGRLIAVEVRRRLPAARPATTFFAGEGTSTAARWRAFLGVLAGWETRGEACADRVIAGATVTFGAMIAALGDAG